MKATISLEGIWQFLQSLNLSNRSKEWLADKLIESTYDKKEEIEYISKEEILAGIDAGLKDMKAGRTRPAEELLEELRNGL
ncbi:surface protein [Phocaeicola salanitronis]|uniref:surface protein n=1 Tax=Phocaeicola salanitronis TaxID=376805 RepID=UPI0025A396B8|nr:surface protein [Phocaeicola salanitronis]MDM8307348.1 surface protein [Phocaeicola salanitronis]